MVRPLQRGTWHQHRITKQAFPRDAPYGWGNYPYDYWNIWVNHAGPEPFTEEPTLEMLMQQYEVIVFKHCFPVSDIGENSGPAEITSSDKTLANYRLQYAALKENWGPADEIYRLDGCGAGAGGNQS